MLPRTVILSYFVDSGATIFMPILIGNKTCSPTVHILCVVGSLTPYCLHHQPLNRAQCEQLYCV